jgi:hypothetical protein
MTRTQQFLKLLQQRQDEAIGDWYLCVRISAQGELVITERRPWGSGLDRSADGRFRAREMVPAYEPIKLYEGLYETEDERVS